MRVLRSTWKICVTVALCDQTDWGYLHSVEHSYMACHLWNWMLSLFEYLKHHWKWTSAKNSYWCYVLCCLCGEWRYTLCLKKVPTFKLSVTLSKLNRFSKFLHRWKAYEICYNTTQHYPTHLRHVATLPCEINIFKCKAIYNLCNQLNNLDAYCK